MVGSRGGGGIGVMGVKSVMWVKRVVGSRGGGGSGMGWWGQEVVDPEVVGVKMVVAMLS